MTYELIGNYPTMKVIDSDPFNAAMFSAFVDLCGYLTSGFIFGRIVKRKKLIFILSYIPALLAVIGLILTNKSGGLTI